MKLRCLFASILALTFFSVPNLHAQQTINADFDSSGAVDFVDFSRLVSLFGLTSDSTRYQSKVDLNQDNAIDGEDAFLFADVFTNTRSTANLTVSTGPNTNAQVDLDPQDNGFLVYLNNVSGIGGYRIVLSMPDTVQVKAVEDHIGIGLLPIKRTPSGVEIVGLVLGNQNLEKSGLIAGITFTADTTLVRVESITLRGKRVDLGNQLFLGDRNSVASTNIKRVPLGDMVVRPRFFDLGEIFLGDTRTRTFDILNTFNNQQVLGATRKLAFEIESSSTDLVADPHVFGVLADTSTGFVSGLSQQVRATFTPTQSGVFNEVLSIKTNRPERPIVRVHVRANVRSNMVGQRVRAVANFDTLGGVDYGDFAQLIDRFGQVPDSTKYDLDGDGVVDGDDAFLFADLLGQFKGRALYDTVRVIPGANIASAVRVQSVGEEMTITVRDLAALGGYRLNLVYDTRVLDIRWAQDLTGGGMLPIRRTSTGAEVVGMGFGGLLEVPGDLPLARISIRPLSGQENAASGVRVASVLFRGHKGERDSVSAVHIGANGLDASPRVLDFGALRLGATATKTFRVYNLNSASTAFQIKSSDSLVTTSPRSVGNLGGGRTWDVTVTYRSQRPGSFASVLTLSADDADTSAVQIAVRAFGSQVAVSVDSLVFADTFVGQQRTLPIAITNPDLSDFEITDVQIKGANSAFRLPTDLSLPLVVPPEGGTRSLNIGFFPVAQGVIADTLLIASVDTTFMVPLKGRGLRRLATISSQTIDFGNVDVGKDSTLSVIVGNAGNVPFRLDSLRVGRRDTSFKYVGHLVFPDTIKVGFSDTLRVRFRPDTTGVKRDTLRIYGQDTTWAVALDGTGLPRETDVQPPIEDVVVVTFAGTITKSRNEIHFGKVPWGVSDTAKVRVENRRSGNLTFRFSATDSQVVVKPDSVQNLPPNQNWDVLLIFTPKDSVQTVSSFRVTTNETGDGTTSLVLKSGGSKPVLSDSLLSFGKIGLGNQVSKVVTVTNTGHSRLVLNSVKTGLDSNFVVVTPPAFPLSIAAEGGTQNFTVRFKPKTRGVLSDTLRFAGIDTSFVLGLNGIGRESILGFGADSLAFGLVRLGQSDTLTTTLVNSGADTVVVDTLRLVRGSGPYKLISTQTFPDTLAPGTNRNLSVAFLPVVAGLVRDTLQVVAGLDTIRARIVGTGSIARATISSLAKDFGDLAVGRTGVDTFVVSNAGNLPIATLGVQLTQNNKHYALLQAPTDTLGVGASLRYIVRFRPDTTGTFLDSLRVQMGDTTFAVALRGRGVPSFTLTRTDNGFSFNPNQLDFGALGEGQTGRRIVRVTNSASSNWTFSTSVNEPGLSVRPSSFTGLPSNQSWELTANWTPEENAKKLTTLRVTTDSTVVIPVGRQGAFVRLFTDSLAFGDIRVSKDSTQFVRIRNDGQANVVLQSMSFGKDAGFALVSPPTLPRTLGERDTLRLGVRFRPTSRGSVSDTLKVVFGDTTLQVPLRARGIEPVITLSREAFNFGNVVTLVDTTISLQFQNTGNGPFVLDSLQLVTDNNAIFSLSAAPFTPSTILGGGDSDTIGVRFRAPDLGDYSASVLVYGEGKVWTLPVTGKSTVTNAAVSGVIISFGPTITLSDSLLNFGAIPFGSTRKLSFEILNSRDSLLAFTVSSSQPQVQIESVSDNSLLPNQNAIVTVAFTPVVGGLFTFDLNIATNASSDGTVNLRVTKDPPPVSMSPLVLDFGSLVIGAQDTLKTVILNPELLNYVVSQRSLVSGQAFSLFEAPSLPDTVRPNGGTKTLTVQFAPTTRGQVTDTLRIVGNSKTFTIALKGNGLASTVAANVDSLVFGDLDVGQDSIATFSISNTGDVGVTLDQIEIDGASFSLTDSLTLPDTLAVGSTQTLGVRFAPVAGGDATGQVRLAFGSTVILIDLRGAGVAPPRVEAGPIALDLNPEVGDQGLRRFEFGSRVITLDVVVTEGALETAGFNLVLQFDTTAVVYSGFTPVDLYDGAVEIITEGADSVKTSVAFFGDQTAPRASGSAGQVQFTLKAGVDSTAIQIVRASFAKAEGVVPLEVGSEGARVVVRATAEPSSDFNGDGKVDFSDFIQFAGKFGTELGDENFDSLFDLNSDGAVGFSDFIIFAGKFGTSTSKPILSKPVSN